MRKVVTAQGKTIEEAVQKGLQQIGLEEHEVEVVIITNPSRRLLGLRKELAEIQLTAKEEVPSKAQQTRADFSQLIDDVLEPESVVDSTVPTEKMGLAIRNGQVIFSEGLTESPVLIPTETTIVHVNGERLSESKEVTAEDVISIAVQDEVIGSQFSIQLIEQEMIALLTFTPGKRITRTLKDTPFKRYVRLDCEEEIELINDCDPQQIVNELKAMGIQQGFDFRAIQKVTEVIKPYELIVAKGQLPIEGTDGDLEVHIDYEEFDPSSLEKVDFREMNAVATIKEGQIIATHLPPVAGTDGRNLVGKTIAVRSVRDIHLQLGKNVEQVEHTIRAKISGRPSLEWREKLVKIDVNHELHHPGEVDLSTGNIRFEGDVRIGGNIIPSMFVGATSVYVAGSVTKATVEAEKEAVIQGNIITSTIQVGEQQVVVQEAVVRLQRLLPLIRQIKEAIAQLFAIRGQGESSLSSADLKRLIYLLIEKKYANFEQVNKHLIAYIHANPDELTEEWQEIATTLHEIFVNPLHEEIGSLIEFDGFIEKLEQLILVHDFVSSPTTQLVIPYAINSELYCSGSIHVTTKGVYHCQVNAGDRVTIKGVCRGGEIRAKNRIDLQETGSESPVKTIVRVEEEGWIRIGKAFVGTEIMVGNRKHIVSVDEVGIVARLDEEGDLILR